MKPIKLSKHARQQLLYRGTTEEEIIETIRTSMWQIGDFGKMECRKNFTFDNIWNKRYYRIKQVRPIFIEENSEIVVITVYTYYFNQEDNRENNL